MSAGRPFNPDVSDRTLLHFAARTILAAALALKKSHTLRGRWISTDACDVAARAEYELHMSLVRELRARAKYAE
jgi:hypothetical protein